MKQQIDNQLDQLRELESQVKAMSRLARWSVKWRVVL